MVQHSTRNHEAWVDGATDDAAQWIPRAVVEPVVEVVETFLGEKLGRPVVEVRIELVDDALETQHGKQTSGERCNRDEPLEPVFMGDLHHTYIGSTL